MRATYDDAALTSQTPGLLVIGRVRGLVGIDEDEVEGLLGGELLHGVEGRSDADLDLGGQACMLEVLTRNLGEGG